MGFKCQHEQNIYLGLAQLPVQWFLRGSFPGDKVVRQGMRLNIHLHFLPVLKVIRAICPLLLCAFTMHTGITLLFPLLYMGLQTNVVYCAVLEVTVRLVSTLVEHLMMKDYSLFIGNDCVSPQLDDYHHTCNIMLCGTLKSNRKGLAILHKTMKTEKVEHAYNNSMVVMEVAR